MTWENIDIAKFFCITLTKQKARPQSKAVIYARLLEKKLEQTSRLRKRLVTCGISDDSQQTGISAQTRCKLVKSSYLFFKIDTENQVLLSGKTHPFWIELRFNSWNNSNRFNHNIVYVEQNKLEIREVRFEPYVGSLQYQTNDEPRMFKCSNRFLHWNGEVKLKLECCSFCYTCYFVAFATRFQIKQIN